MSFEVCLVTGGAGFIGSNLVDTLIENKKDVIALDNLSRGRAGFLSQHNGKNGFRFIQGDIKNFSDYPVGGVDVVYHLAANADVRGGVTDPTIDLDENVIGTHMVLEYMRKYDVRELVFASSSAVYGENVIHPSPEEASPLYPISHYGASKLAGEAFVSSYCYTYGIQGWMFRFANVIGKRSTHGVIPDFVAKLQQNPKELEILGDGCQCKSFFDVSDCVRGLLEIPEKANTVVVDSYNLANTDSLRVREIADCVCKELGLKGVRYRFTGGDRGWLGDVPVTLLSIEKAKKLGWSPLVCSRDAIHNTVDFLVNGGN